MKVTVAGEIVGAVYTTSRPETVAVPAAGWLVIAIEVIGATLVSKKIFDAVRGGSGFFQHGHTYLGHPMACAAALAVQHTIRDV